MEKCFGGGCIWRKGRGAHAAAVCPIALIANAAFAYDLAVCVGFFVGGDVAGAAAAVGDNGAAGAVLGGHIFLGLVGGRISMSYWRFMLVGWGLDG